MAKDPAFLFYPGDYLRDTQCLSEKSQVAYDRIMCEHMRNICITQEQLNFFTKRLNEDEKNELLFVLNKIKGGYQISWVSESICKRRSYSESRANNRKGKNKKDMKTHDNHMENENVNENVNDTMWTKIKKDFLQSESWQRSFMDSKKVSLSNLKNLQLEFLKELELKEDFKDLKELKRHFVNTYNLNIKNNGTKSSSSKQSANSDFLAEAKAAFQSSIDREGFN